MRPQWPVYVLALFLFAWEPLRIAAELLQALPTLDMRGWPAIAELIGHAVAAAVCVAGALALWNGAEHGPGLAIVALALSAGVSVQSLYWTRLPSQTPPGAHLTLATIAVVHASAWIVYLSAARRG